MQPRRRWELTDRQRAFLLAYLGPAAGNAKEAARLAGYGERSAKQRGYKLRHHAHLGKILDAAQRAQYLAWQEQLRYARRG